MNLAGSQRDFHERLHSVLFGDSKNRTSGNAQLDAARLDTTRRRDFKEDDATVPVALGMWVYSAVARCLANEAGRSLDSTRFDAAGRVTNQAPVYPPAGYAHRA